MAQRGTREGNTAALFAPPTKQPLPKGQVMPRVYRTRKGMEQLLIREFVRSLGYKVLKCKWQEGPDAILTLSKGKKRVAIEHTDYFNDTLAGVGSPLTPIAEFWKAVHASLMCRISHRRHLAGIGGRVSLKRNTYTTKNCTGSNTHLARQLAEGLVAFAEDHPVRKHEYPRFRHRDFGKYPILDCLCDRLLLSRVSDDAIHTSHCSWRCSNITTGIINLNLEYIKSAIENKNKKADKYKWDNADEKWLLIAAGGGHLGNGAGPCTQNVNWADPNLVALCHNSPFDGIVFWERICRWYKWLKPDEDVVQYENPYIH
jgi:hypothetical protein